MEAQLKGAVLIALVVVPQWRCPILKPLSAKLPPKSETAPHPGWQDGTILQPGTVVSDPMQTIVNAFAPCLSALCLTFGFCQLVGMTSIESCMILVLFLHLDRV